MLTQVTAWTSLREVGYWGKGQSTVFSQKIFSTFIASPKQFYSTVLRVAGGSYAQIQSVKAIIMITTRHPSLSRSGNTNENVIWSILNMSLPGISKTSLTALSARTSSKAHSFCFLRDGKALALLCSKGRKGQPHKSACLVSGESAFFWYGPCMPGSGWFQRHLPCVHGRMSVEHPGIKSVPNPKIHPEPQSSPWAPVRHSLSAQWHPWHPSPGQVLLIPTEQDDSALNRR